MTDGASTASPDPRIGTTLGGYRIDGVAGRGGMGVVYRAWDPSLDRPVALKLLPADLGDDESFRQRFLRETRLAAAIDHPNIIPIYEAGDDSGTLFLAMRLVDGVDLDRRLAAGPLDVAATVALLSPVASALDVAHAGGLIHRDVKPANILVGGSSTGAESVYLTDFGLTKQRASDSGLTRTGSFLGTVEYMAPEQIDGRPVTEATDEYALACTVFRCLTGQVPFERDAAIATAMAHIKEPPPKASAIRPGIPSAVDDVIARGMAKDPSERYTTCRDLIAALEQAGAPLVTAPLSRRPVRAAVVGLVAVALLAVAGAVALGQGRAPATTATPSVPALASVAAATASPTPTVAPSSTAFPTAAETRLLDTLPSDIQKTCVRGRGDPDLVAAGFNGTVIGVQGGPPSPGTTPVNQYHPVLSLWPPDASLACHPVGGPNGAWFFWYRLEGATDPQAPAEVSVASIGGRNKVPDHECSNPPGRGTWQSAAGAAGKITCLASGPSGQPWLYWSFGSAHVLGVATAPAGHYAALYAWWQDVTPFLK